MKKCLLLVLLICLSAKDEITESNNAKVFSFFVQNIPRHTVKQVDGGDYVSLEISSYTKGSYIDVYCAFNSTEDLDSFSYKYRSYDTNDMIDFITSLFWDGTSSTFTKNGTEYNFSMSWKRTSSYDYLLFIPQKIGGDNKITIQNDYPRTRYEVIIMLVIFGVIIVAGIIIVLIVIFKKKS